MDVALAGQLAPPEIMELLFILREWSYVGYDNWVNALDATAHTLQDILRMIQP